MSRTTSRRRSRLARRLRKMIGMTLLEIMIVLAILALVMGLLVGPQVLKLFDDSKVDIARAGVNKLANSSYPMWSSRPANSGKCPTVQQLAELGGNIKDPWDQEYVVKCDGLPAEAKGFGVVSKGPDKSEGTGDDIKSWELQ